MSFITSKKNKPQQRTRQECKEAIITVIEAGTLTDEQLNKIVNLLQDPARLQRALLFL